jgi:hypothetical protein
VLVVEETHQPINLNRAGICADFFFVSACLKAGFAKPPGLRFHPEEFLSS